MAERLCGFDARPGHQNNGKWRNWQTRQPQKLLGETHVGSWPTLPTKHQKTAGLAEQADAPGLSPGAARHPGSMPGTRTNRL